MRHMSEEAVGVKLEYRGAVPGGAGDLARSRMSAVILRAPEPVLFARVKLSMAADPAVARPAIAQANLDVNGRPVRAHVAAPSMSEAIDLLHDRLLDRMERISRHWEAIRGRAPKPGPHEWRHGAEPTHRPSYFPRPIEERELVRHKTFALAVESPDEAAFDMELMDYGFHLFTDSETLQDSVLYRTADGYRMAQINPRPVLQSPVAVPLTISPHPAARLSVTEATERLEATGLPFVFFVDTATGHGNLLYHRYDGHYGLITPAR